MFGRKRLQPERLELVLDITPGEVAASINGVKLISGANVKDKFSTFLDHLAVEVFVLNADHEQRRIIGDAKRAKGKLHVALILPSKMR
jgi:predicted Rossmann-fold nucleotide-binding protein